MVVGYIEMNLISNFEQVTLSTDIKGIMPFI